MYRTYVGEEVEKLLCALVCVWVGGRKLRIWTSRHPMGEGIVPESGEASVLDILGGDNRWGNRETERSIEFRRSRLPSQVATVGLHLYVSTRFG